MNISSYHHNFYRAYDVHGAGDGGRQVEEDADGASEFRPERSADHEVGAAGGDDAVCGDSGHGDGREHCLQREKEDASKDEKFNHIKKGPMNCLVVI